MSVKCSCSTIGYIDYDIRYDYCQEKQDADEEGGAGKESGCVALLERSRVNSHHYCYLILNLKFLCELIKK